MPPFLFTNTKYWRQLFLFKDRKNTGYLLSPTHEEEITDLVASIAKSHKQMPVRLYQICITGPPYYTL